LSEKAEAETVNRKRKKTIGSNEVHAITGASYTSKGIEDIITKRCKPSGRKWRQIRDECSGKIHQADIKILFKR
jgi:hypothetical protein